MPNWIPNWILSGCVAAALIGGAVAVIDAVQLRCLTPPSADGGSPIGWFDPRYWDWHRGDNRLPDIWLDGHRGYTTRDLMGRNI